MHQSHWYDVIGRIPVWLIHSLHRNQLEPIEIRQCLQHLVYPAATAGIAGLAQ